MPLYKREETAVWTDTPSTLHVAGVRRDDQMFSQQELESIITEHLARQSPHPVREMSIFRSDDGTIKCLVRFGEDPDPIPF